VGRSPRHNSGAHGSAAGPENVSKPVGRSGTFVPSGAGFKIFPASSSAPVPSHPPEASDPVGPTVSLEIDGIRVPLKGRYLQEEYLKDLDTEEILMHVTGLSAEKISQLNELCVSDRTTLSNKIKRLIEFELRQNASLLQNARHRREGYDKSRPLVDASKDRGAEVNRLKSVFKITVDQAVLDVIDRLAKAAGTDRSSFVADLVVNPPVDPAKCAKRLASGENRKRSGLRLTDDTRRIAQKYADAAGMRPGAWVGRLMEGYVSLARSADLN